jgi:NADPH:quinone reductase-like Zn-dependent oxidoreductase
VKALLFRQKGAAENVLELGDTKIPDVLPGDVRVKVLASPINPADFMFIEKTYRVEPVYPQIAGFEGAGMIVDNRGDHRFPINTLVAFRHKNVWAEYVNVPKNKLIRVPENMPIEKAAQLSLNPLTAWALLEELNAKEGEWIIMSAGNSALCKLIIQFAKDRQLKTIAIIRENDPQEQLLRFGATAILRSNDEELETQVKGFVGNQKIAGFLDAVGGELASKIIKLISDNGKVIHYGLFSNQPVMYHNADLIFKNLLIKGFGIDGWLNTKTAAELENIWDCIIKDIMNPDFSMEVAGRFSLEAYKNAVSESKFVKNGKVLFIWGIKCLAAHFL